MLKLWKALAIVAVLVLLFLPTLQRGLPKIPWVILFMVALTFGISLFFSAQMPVFRRFGIAYLVLTGLTYLLAGILGLLPNGDLIEAEMWYFLISPYPLLRLLTAMIYSRPFRIDAVPYTIFPASGPHLWFSITVVLVSTILIVAAFAMAREKRTAYYLWLFILALSILEALGYVVAQFGKWGVPQYRGTRDSAAIIVPLSWAASYLAAYVMARRGADLGKAGSP